MKKCRIRFWVSVIFVLFLCYSANSVYAFDISCEIKSSLKTISFELKSPLAKIGLESLVYRFHKARVERKPAGHEGKQGFKDSFFKAFDSFRQILWEKPESFVNIEERINEKEIAQIEKSFRKNEKVFNNFVHSLSKDSYFKNISYNTIIKSQLYFYFVLSDNKRILDEVKHFTHVWPFC